MFFMIVKMLKKKLGAEALELNWSWEKNLTNHFKIPSTLIIPDGVKRIGSYAFWRCSEIKAVYIPKNIKSIGWRAFCGCKKLRNIICEKKVITVINNSSCRLDLDDFKSTRVRVISDAAMKNIQKVNTLTNRKV